MRGKRGQLPSVAACEDARNRLRPLCPSTPLGAVPPDPRYRLALRASHAFHQINIATTPLVHTHRQTDSADTYCLSARSLFCVSRQKTTPTPHHLMFTGRMLFLTPNQQCQCTEDTIGGAELLIKFPWSGMCVCMCSCCQHALKSCVCRRLLDDCSSTPEEKSRAMKTWT